jgi:hypothetical protein
MSKALVVRTEMDVMTLGDVLVESHFFSDSTQAAQAVVKVLAGQELGFGPIASMTGINIIKGRVTLSANLLAAAIKRSGKYNYIVDRLDDTGCILTFTENEQPIGTTSFTKADADRAKLSGENWQKYPRNMFFARTISNGAKFYCPDIFGGPVYTPDELGASIDGETGEVIDGSFLEQGAPFVPQSIHAPAPVSSPESVKTGRKADAPPVVVPELPEAQDEFDNQQFAKDYGDWMRDDPEEEPDTTPEDAPEPPPASNEPPATDALEEVFWTRDTERVKEMIRVAGEYWKLAAGPNLYNRILKALELPERNVGKRDDLVAYVQEAYTRTADDARAAIKAYQSEPAPVQ